MGLMVSVVPRVVEQFDNVDQQLPLITRIVIGKLLVGAHSRCCLWCVSVRTSFEAARFPYVC